MEVQPLSWEDPLEEGVAAHSRIPAWRIPWTEEPGGLQSMGAPRVGHDRSDLARTHTHTHVHLCLPHRPGASWGPQAYLTLFCRGTQSGALYTYRAHTEQASRWRQEWTRDAHAAYTQPTILRVEDGEHLLSAQNVLVQFCSTTPGTLPGSPAHFLLDVLCITYYHPCLTLGAGEGGRVLFVLKCAPSLISIHFFFSFFYSINSFLLTYLGISPKVNLAPLHISGRYLHLPRPLPIHALNQTGPQVWSTLLKWLI